MASGFSTARSRLIAFACVVALVAGCDSSDPAPTIAPSDAPAAPTAAATATPGPDTSSFPPVDAALSPRPATAPGAPAGLLLAEVLFDPLPGGSPFVEVLNPLPEPADLSETTLTVDGRGLLLASAGPSLPPGQRITIVFDGRDRTETGVIHAPPGVGLEPKGGAAELHGTAGRMLDRVAWGSEPDAVSPGPGGIVPERVDAGSSIGRPPGALGAGQRLDWVVYGPQDASPGEPNPPARVEILLPLDGAILDDPGPVLAWYPVVGATGYRVQVTSGTSFSSPVIDATVSDAEIAVGALPAGAYRWHVAPIGSGDKPGPFSDANQVTLEGAASAAVTTRLASSGETAAVTVAATLPRRLSVPYLTQHKDTAMLLLESPTERGPHAWDADHGGPARGDPADTKNCAIAAVAIMNRHFGGDMSQDRLGYEVLHNRQAGPELDLMYGTGLTVADATTMLNFALGGGVTVEPAYLDWADFWRDVTTQIDAGRPVMAANSRHTFVITGYTIENGHRIMYIHDPANGRYRRDLDAVTADPADHSVWITPAHPVGRDQEPEVTKDTDRDGVVDFDETRRFGTDPGDRDSDGDKLDDKADIATGIFDPLYGYAIHPGAAGRDFDGDGIPTERDKDSDEGACWDGEEDKSGDGHRNGAETYNFDTTDDVCMAYRVTITWSETFGGRTDKFNFEGVIDTVDPNALGDVLFLTGSGTVSGSRQAWAACSVNIDAPSGTSNAFFGATIIGDKVTIGAFAIDGPLIGINTRDFELPKDGGTQYYSGEGSGELCPYSWAAKVVAEALFDH